MPRPPAKKTAARIASPSAAAVKRGSTRPASETPDSSVAAKRPPRERSGPEGKPVDDESEVLIHRYLAAYVMGLANRLSNGASAHYRRHWNIGMSEWRAMMAIGASSHRIAREVAEMADLDNAAASKSLRALQARGYVELAPTTRRGGATLVRLTPDGLRLYEELKASAVRRQKRLVAAFTPAETAALWVLLRKLHRQIPAMNDDETTVIKRRAPKPAA